MLTLHRYNAHLSESCSIKQCQSDEIGRHDGFKIRCLHGRAGSSPASGTILRILCKVISLNKPTFESVFLCLAYTQAARWRAGSVASPIKPGILFGLQTKTH